MCDHLCPCGSDSIDDFGNCRACSGEVLGVCDECDNCLRPNGRCPVCHIELNNLEYLIHNLERQFHGEAEWDEDIEDYEGDS